MKSAKGYSHWGGPEGYPKQPGFAPEAMPDEGKRLWDLASHWMIVAEDCAHRMERKAMHDARRKARDVLSEIREKGYRVICR